MNLRKLQTNRLNKSECCATCAIRKECAIITKLIYADLDNTICDKYQELAQAEIKGLT
jgi:hypothetical protein